jgi:hypothetical protein
MHPTQMHSAQAHPAKEPVPPAEEVRPTTSVR